MAAAKDRIGTRQPDLPVSGGALAAASSHVDAAWLAQAIEARELAFRLYLQTDLSSIVRLDVCCPSPIEDTNKLMADYLTANEKLFDLTSALARREHAPQPPNAVDNSRGAPTADDLCKERIQE
jgi:hypothetical protein